KLEELADPQTWYAALGVLAVMVVLFIVHHALHWEPWVVAVLGLTVLLFIGRKVDMDSSLQDVEMSLLMFFASLFVLVGGVENSHFLEYLGQFIRPFVESDLLLSSPVSFARRSEMVTIKTLAVEPRWVPLPPMPTPTARDHHRGATLMPWDSM
ncbi:hypothetical protein QQ73_11070, partial [Candidatus Endoriftia persephone str. Guaymas]|nr:hypothetical protein [Candidatus Endoriftia persephone str. Guaymas]